MEAFEQRENSESRVPKNLQPHVFKKGESGNYNGRPVGSVSMKTYVKNMLQGMTHEERLTFLEGIDKKVLWEMAEGKADQKTEMDGKLLLVKFDDAFNNGEDAATPTSEEHSQEPS